MYMSQEDCGIYITYMRQCMTKTSKWHVRPAKTQRSAWASAQPDQSLLCAQWVAKYPSFLHADSEDSDQTGWMPTLNESSLGVHVILYVLSCAASYLLS